jgi:hypothetical protein
MQARPSLWFALVTVLVGQPAFAGCASAMGHAFDMGAEPSLSAATPIRVRLHWGGNQGGLVAQGNAVAMAGDTLLLENLIMYRLPDMSGIEISRGLHGHGGVGALIGGAAGIVLGLLAFQSYTSNPLLSHPSNPNAGGLTVLGGAAFGALVGAGIGTLIRTERWETVDRDRLRGLLEHGPAPSMTDR